MSRFPGDQNFANQARLIWADQGWSFERRADRLSRKWWFFNGLKKRVTIYSSHEKATRKGGSCSLVSSSRRITSNDAGEPC